MRNKDEVHFLNILLSNCFIMYVKLHRYHWYIQGKHFFQLHEEFEDMYNSFAKDLDQIAERILTIDGKPYATMEKFLKFTTLEEAVADDEEDEIIDQLIQDYDQITSEIKTEGIPSASKQQDEPTVDMLIGIQGKLEKYIWMLQAYRADKQRPFS